MVIYYVSVALHATHGNMSFSDSTVFTSQDGRANL